MTTGLPAHIDLEATVELTVPFHDADPLGVAWHGNYFRYFELARCALLERIDYGYQAMAASGFIWPIVRAEVKYVKPLPFDSRVRVRATLLEWEYRLRIAYAVFTADGQQATTGSTVQAAVDVATREMAIGAPAVLRECLRRYLDARPAP